MKEIICPNCGKAFTIDEAGYADILKQVRDTDFEKQLHDRLELAEQEKQRAIELAETKAAGELQKAAAAKDSEIQELKAKLDAGESENKLAVAEALSALEAEKAKLASELEQARAEKQSAVELAEAKLAAKLQDQLAGKAAEVEKLKASIQASDQAKQLAVIEATTRVEKERDRLKADLEMAEAQKALGEKALQDKYETQIKDRDDAIERLKDMKARLSTKMDDGGSNSTARPSSTAFVPRRFRRRTSRKTTTCGRGARATTSSRILMRPAPRSCRSCSR